jgi:Holliday junction resolvase RusA-like endonuclease
VGARKIKPVEGAAVEPMTLMFVIPGAPRSKKNSSRAFTRGRFPRVLPSAAYVAWHEAAERAFDAEKRALEAAGRIPIGRPVAMKALYFRDRNVGDLSNFENALQDFLQAIGVLVDDKWIVSKDGSRLAIDRERPRIDVTLEVLGG